MLRSRYLYICIFFLYSVSLFSEEKLQISFEDFPYMSQLPSNSVQRLFQDKEGFMWFGTLDGLSRYDGYNVINFRSDMNFPSLLTNNDILSLTEDSKGRLWIGTKQGLNLLDKSNFKISAFRSDIFQNDRINSLAEDANGNIWIGTHRGLYLYDITKDQIKSFPSDPFDKKTIPGTSIVNIYRDKSDNIWILIWGEGLCRYNQETSNFTRYPRFGVSNVPFRIYQDKKGIYWVGSWGDGLFKFDPKLPEDKMIQPVPFTNSPLNTSETTIFSLVQDDKYGYIWIMSLAGLYAIKNNPDNSISNIDISGFLKGSSKLYSEIIKDKDGNLWIGAFSEGPIFINFERPLVKNYNLETLRQKMGFYLSIKALSEDKDGLVWLGLNRKGICLYNRKTNDATLFSDIPGLDKIPNIETVNFIREIKSRGETWICGNFEQIFVFRKINGRVIFDRFIDINIKEGIDLSGNKVLFEDNLNNVWVGTTGGLFKVRPDNKVSFISQIPSVTDISQDKDGNIWVGSEQSGLFRFTKTDKGFKSFNFDKYSKGLNTNNIQSVAYHPSGLIWIGTKEGRVLTYNNRKNTFKDVSNLCAMTGEGILNILVDKLNNVWISTNKRVTRFNPLKETSTYYSVYDNLAVNSFIDGAFSKTNNGEVLFGGNRGFCSFIIEREQDKPKQKSINVRITDVKIHNQSVYKLNQGASYNNKTGKLTLTHNEKNIEIEFSSLNYAFPSKVQYAYKLEGVDNEWIYAGNNRRFANYNNLRKGSYKFMIKATDENGLWSDKITYIEILKKPAFYETIPAIITYIILALLILYLFYRFSLNRLNLREELRIARIEKEKSEELTQTKLSYFTNISHELLTPLTIISCLVDDIKEVSGKDLWQYNVMKVNVTRLKRLLQQILDFRKVESGNMKLKVSNADIVAFVSNICNYNFNPLAKDKQLHFSMVSSEEKINAWFDSEKMDIVMFNLLSNAFKYNKTGGSVKVDIEKIEKNSAGYIRIRVIDTGIGIPKNDLDNIFKRFYSSDPSNSVENHGIGLTLTKELIELHHGKIEVESQIGNGSVFTVEIPSDKEFYSVDEVLDQDYITDITTTEEFTEVETPATKTDINLLIVEDNGHLRNLMKKILDKKYNTFVAENGLIAKKVIEESPIDIVVSDIIMPGMDGLELCRILKSDINTSHISVLLLTAKNSDDDRIESYNAGADGFLSKPFELKVLEAKISSLVRNRKHKSDSFKSNVEINISSLDITSIDERFMETAIGVIEEHLSEPDFDLDMFAGKLNMSKSSLYRKIKSLTGLSPVEFTKNIRLKHACQMLNKQMGNISDIAYSVGFADPKYFTSCFKTEFGMTPSEFIKQRKSNGIPD